MYVARDMHLQTMTHDLLRDRCRCVALQSTVYSLVQHYTLHTGSTYYAQPTTATAATLELEVSK